MSVPPGVWVARLLAALPPWLRRWGISIASLALGLATLVVFRRGLPHAGWIVGYLLLLWLLFALVAQARAPIDTRAGRLALGAARYTIQTLCHNLLLFVLPAYYAAATLNSANALFLGGVATGVVLTAVDPWYASLLRGTPWARHLLLGFSSFAALNVALPLVGVRPILALEASAALAALGLTPAFRRGGLIPWKRAHARAVVLAGVAAVAVWVARGAVPPAPLFLTRAVAARDVVRLEPVDEVGGAVPAAMLETWGGLAAYSAIHAPTGLRQPIEHVWWKNGEMVARIPLSPIQGGRTEGFRTYSRRRDFRPPLAGRYTVDVMTASGQLIGRLRFTVTP